MLGIRGTTPKNVANDVAKQAETASRWLWLKRGERWPNPAGRERGVRAQGPRPERQREPFESRSLFL